MALGRRKTPARDTSAAPPSSSTPSADMAPASSASPPSPSRVLRPRRKRARRRPRCGCRLHELHVGDADEPGAGHDAGAAIVERFGRRRSRRRQARHRIPSNGTTGAPSPVSMRAPPASSTRGVKVVATRPTDPSPRRPRRRQGRSRPRCRRRRSRLRCDHELYGRTQPMPSPPSMQPSPTSNAMLVVVVAVGGARRRGT